MVFVCTLHPQDVSRGIVPQEQELPGAEYKMVPRPQVIRDNYKVGIVGMLVISCRLPLLLPIPCVEQQTPTARIPSCFHTSSSLIE